MTSNEVQNALFGENAIKSYTNDGKGFTGLISSFLPTVFVVAGFILFLYVFFGGFLLISSGGDEKKAETGKEALTNAIIGFVIIFASYWLIQIIEVITGVPIL